jgi:hypothetical protein
VVFVGASERVRAGEMTAVGDNQAAERDAALRDHLQWLASQQAELADMRRSDATDEEGEVYTTSNAFTDRPMYRSIDDLCATISLADEQTTGDGPLELGMDEVDEAIYRSVGGVHGSAMDADALWVRGTRPPLLKRQRACSDLFNPHSASAYGQDMSH